MPAPRPILPPFLKAGTVRNDVPQSCSAAALVEAVKRDAAIGQPVVLELSLDPRQCSWWSPDDTTTRCLVKGRVARSSVDDGAVTGFPPAVQLHDVVVTSAQAPRELAGRFLALVELKDDRWTLTRFKPAGW